MEKGDLEEREVEEKRKGIKKRNKLYYAHVATR